MVLSSRATRVLWVADKLAGPTATASDARSRGVAHVGGAELTDAAAIAACPFAIDVRRVRDLGASALPELDRYDLVVVGNAASARPELVAAIAKTRRHVSFEHDLRWCRWRGDFPEAREPGHRLAQRCRCRGERWRAFYAGARGVVHLTGRQRRAFHDNPFFPRGLAEVVLGSSLFSAETLALIASLRERADAPPAERERARTEHTAVAWSPAPIKGYRVTLERCLAAGWPVREIRKKTYPETLALLARSARFAYLPLGLEPAGRMPVEARLLGCEVVTNAHVGVAHEPVWTMPATAALAHLADGPARFWRLVDDLLADRVAPGASSAAEREPERDRSRGASLLAIARELASVRRQPVAADAWLSARVAADIAAETIAAPWPATRGSW